MHAFTSFAELIHWFMQTHSAPYYTAQKQVNIVSVNLLGPPGIQCIGPILLGTRVVPNSTRCTGRNDPPNRAIESCVYPPGELTISCKSQSPCGTRTSKSLKRTFRMVTKAVCSTSGSRQTTTKLRWSVIHT